MNRLETLLDQAKAEAKNINQESYSKGFRDAEGALTTMQKMFNDVQNVLLKALGRKRRATEDTLDTAIEMANLLISLNTNKYLISTLPSWEWPTTPPALFGGTSNLGATDSRPYDFNTTYTSTPKPLVFSEDTNTPCTAALEVKLSKLIAYFERRAKENTKRAEKLEKNANTFQYLNEYVQGTRSSYYFSGKADSYKRAAEKLREALKELNPVIPQPTTLPVEEWITEYISKPCTLSSVWRRSTDYGLGDVFPSREAAQAAVDKDAPNYFYITRRVRRVA